MDENLWSGPFLDSDEYCRKYGVRRRSSLVQGVINPFACCGDPSSVNGSNGSVKLTVGTFARRRRRSSTTFNSMVITYCADARAALRWPSRVNPENRIGLWFQAAGLLGANDSIDESPAFYLNGTPEVPANTFFSSPINSSDHCLGDTGLRVANIILKSLQSNDGHLNGEGQFSLPTDTKEYCPMIPDLLCCMLAFATRPLDVERLLVRLLERSSATPSELVSGPTMFLAMSKSSMLLFWTVFDDLIGEIVPTLSKLFSMHQIRPSQVVRKLQWFERLFFGALQYPVAVRVVDSFVAEGSKILFRVAVALFILLQDTITAHVNANRHSDTSGLIQSLCDAVKMETLAVGTNALFKVAYSLPIRRKSISSYSTKHMLAMATVCGLSDTVSDSLFWHPSTTEWVGFDLDHTLVTYNENIMTQITYDAVLEYLCGKDNDPLIEVYEQVRSRSYSETRSLALVGTKIDATRGNIFKVGANGTISLLFHGTNLATPAELAEVQSQEDYRNILEATSFSTINTHFEYMICPLYALIVSEIDKQVAKKSNGTIAEEDFSATADNEACRKLYKTSFETLKSAFVFAQSKHSKNGFENTLQNRLRQVVPKQPEVAQFLSNLRRKAGRKLFLLTNGKLSHTHLLMKHAYGNNWKNYFDLIIVEAKKSKFFELDNEKPFTLVEDENGVQVLDTRLTECPGLELESGKIYSGGSARELNSYFQNRKGGEDGTVMYFGDHLLQDVKFPKRFDWKTGAILSELDHFAWQCSGRLKKAVNANTGTLAPSKTSQTALRTMSSRMLSSSKQGSSFASGKSRLRSPDSAANVVSPLPTVPSFTTISASSRSLLSPDPLTATTKLSPVLPPFVEGERLAASVPKYALNSNNLAGQDLDTPSNQGPASPANTSGKLTRATTMSANEFKSLTANAQYLFLGATLSLGNPFLAEVSVSPTLLAKEIAETALVCVPSLRHLARLDLTKPKFSTKDLSKLYMLSPENVQLITKLDPVHLKQDAMDYFLVH